MCDRTDTPAVARTSPEITPPVPSRPPRPAYGVAIVTECHCCGHEADDALGSPRRRCPKCGGSAWARFPRLIRDQSGDGAQGAYGRRRAPFNRPAHHVSSSRRLPAR
jgi:hypothetical protein